MVKIPSKEDLLKAAVHFGHRPTKRHPKMQPFIQAIKNTIHIIDLEKTLQLLKKAVNFVTEVVSRGGVIVFVGTKPAAKEVIKKYAQKVNVPYVAEKWIGGTLTNFQTISHLIEKLKKMTKEQKEGEWKKYSKKERLDLEKELAKLEKMVGGIKDLNRLPEALYIVDIIEESTAVKEAKKMNIPVIAIVDTNANPELVTYPIPANDDAIKSIDLITKLIAEAIEEGQNKIKNNPPVDKK